MKKLIFLFVIIISCYACAKDSINKDVVLSSAQKDIEISNNSILKVNLGNFGDEEGVGIYKNPQNAKISLIEREATSNVIYYKYLPKDGFIGTDTVVLTLNHGSDGASLGNTDTMGIVIHVVK
jgi:hypothetical protein